MICLALTQLFHTLLCSCFEVKQPKKFGFCASQGMHRPREDSEHSETSARQSGKRFFLILEVHHGVTIPQGQHHVSSAQKSQVLFGGDSSWMGDHIRIPRVVITFFFFLFQGDIKESRTAILV